MSSATLVPGTTDRVLARLFPQPDPFADDPVGWVDERLREFLWSKQREVARSVVHHRYTAVPSAHDTGKSFSASRLIAWWIGSHPAGSAFAVSTAPTATQVEVILWREIGRAHRKGDLPGRITSGAVPMWKLGDEIVAYGRKPQDLTSPEDAAAAFQGVHAPYVLVVLDEAGGIPKWLWDAVDTLVTNENARVLAIGNPDNPASQFEKVCRPGSGWNVIPISAFDTPAFTGEDVPEDLLQVLVSQTWVDERKRRWGESSSLYTSKVLGRFPEETEDTVIAPSLIAKAQLNSTLPGLELGQYGADIADQGHDRTVIYRNRGGVVRLVSVLPRQTTMKTAGGLKRLILETKLEVPMWVDGIGVGAGVLDRLREQDLPVRGFIASERARNPRKFANRRAEAWWGARTLFEEGLIDLDPADEDLAAQLSGPKWHNDSAGRIVIESKKDMAKRGLPSPDHADAFVMSLLAPPVSGLDLPADDHTSDLLERSF